MAETKSGKQVDLEVRVAVSRRRLFEEESLLAGPFEEVPLPPEDLDPELQLRRMRTAAEARSSEKKR